MSCKSYAQALPILRYTALQCTDRPPSPDLLCEENGDACMRPCQLTDEPGACLPFFRLCGCSVQVLLGQELKHVPAMMDAHDRSVNLCL